MRSLWRFLITFLALTGAVALAAGLFGVQFAHEDFWRHHSIPFLIFITVFPRLTLLFSSVATGGMIWWLGWLFAPRFLVAVLATAAYWNMNPILVVLSWIVALGGESSEKYVVIQRSRTRRELSRGFDTAKWVEPQD